MNITDFIGVQENAFSPEYCNTVIDYFEALDKSGYTMSRQKLAPDANKVVFDDDALDHSMHEVAMSFTEHAHHFNKIFYDKLFKEYVEKYDVLLAGDKLINTHIKLQRTKVGGGYHVWHYEDGARWAASRILAWTLYLNDVDEGGETEFLYYPRRVKAQQGKFMIWPAGFTHTHRGNPPISNTKYILTGWIGF